MSGTRLGGVAPAASILKSLMQPAGTGAPGKPASPPPGDQADAHPPRRRSVRILWILLVLIALVAIFSAVDFSHFATVFNVQNIASDGAVLLVIAVGQTYVIISKGIDLSVGSVLVFSGVVAAEIIQQTQGTLPLWLAIVVAMIAAVLSGIAWGTINGTLITLVRVPPLITTLGTLGIALGFAEIITGGNDISGMPLQLTSSFGAGKLFGQIPWLAVVALAVFAVFGWMLACTTFGRWTYAIGSNAEAARRVGIRVNRHIVAVYLLSGALAGLAGFLSLAQFSSTTLTGHGSDNLAAITAVVLGGASLFGGVGTMTGTLIGVLIPEVLLNGFVILGFQPFWQSVAIGVVLIAAVAVDQLKKRGATQ